MPRGDSRTILNKHFFQQSFVDLGGAVGIDIDRQRLGDADRIGELDRDTLGQARRDDVFGKIARRIGGGAVHLGRILAGEGAAAMRGRAAVSIDNDLAAGEAGVAIGSANHEFAGGIDVPHSLVGNPALGQRS